SSSADIYSRALEILSTYPFGPNGATGSRLLSGNHKLFSEAETMLAHFHQTEAALFFNSGYDANLGLLASVPQRGDIILFDELCHASIRDGIQMSHAKSYKFKHNDLEDLSRLQDRLTKLDDGAEIYIVTESVFSMDGDSPDLKSMATICKTHNAKLIVDEAHAVGVFGTRGEGKVQELGMESQVFARIVTFGKALGCHGAAVLGSADLKTFLINFARSFIYTTALSPHAVATIMASYEQLAKEDTRREKLKHNIAILQDNVKKFSIENFMDPGSSSIHCCRLPGNSRVKKIAQELMDTGFDVRPILSPTVPAGEERLRICLHSFNSEKEIRTLIESLHNAIIMCTHQES
ncbi:MAG: aminotransferase class I/II-fold pyridoxal phosphate-dependent enzyme, partial [Bacteroidota bacterium]